MNGEYLDMARSHPKIMQSVCRLPGTYSIRQERYVNKVLVKRYNCPYANASCYEDVCGFSVLSMFSGDQWRNTAC